MKAPSPFSVSCLALFSIATLDLLICPHSKVEESFQLQATHDLFYHGIGPAWRKLWGVGNNEPLPYDHLEYPGGTTLLASPCGVGKKLTAHHFLIYFQVVPRTFLGPIILTLLCQFTRYICLPIFDIATRPLFVQFMARFFLMAINLWGWIRLARSADRYNIQKTSRGGVGSWLLLITASQFHIPFYSSRMLPNTFALAIVLQAYASWLGGSAQIAASLIVFATTVFRCDILLLLASVGTSWLITKRLSILGALKIGILTGLVSLMITVPMDSLLWQRPVWPEGEVFYFNSVLGKSSEWGTSPWHWYFTAAIPKSMILTLLLVPLSILRIPELLALQERKWRTSSDGQETGKDSLGWTDTTWTPFLLPICGFVMLYSNLGHKEMRFIFPALPILNVAAASSMSRLSELAKTRKDKAPTLIGRLTFIVGILCVVLTLMGSLTFVFVSRWNYPGGDSLEKLSNHLHRSFSGSNGKQADVSVYIDVASAMSGVSLFGQRALQYQNSNGSIAFLKAGYEKEHTDEQGIATSCTHALSDSPGNLLGFEVVGESLGNPRLQWKELRIETKPSIFILEKEGYRQK